MKRWAFRVEILAGALGWVDITVDVRGELSITRGRSGEGYRADPGKCGFRLDNRSGRYSPRNPASDLYGLIGKNTPVRVHAGPIAGTLVPRFYGEIPSWPPRWSLSGADRYVDLDAAGVLRRFRQGDQPALSPMRRTIEGSEPVAYWPGEDGDLSTQAGAATSGLSPLYASGVVEFKPVENYVFATSTTTYGTTALADLAAGGSLSAQLSGDAAVATAGGPWTVHAAVLVDTLATLSGDVVVLEWTTAGGTYTRWQIKVTTTSRTQVIGFTPAGASALLIDHGSASPAFHHYSASASVSGGTVTVRLQTSNSVNLTTTFAGSVGGVTSVAVNPTGATSTSATPAGHIAVWDVAPVPIPIQGANDAYGAFVRESRRSNLGEAAVDRLIRLAAEVGLDVDAAPADPNHVSRMNIQEAASTTAAIDDAIAVDGGTLYESRDAGSLAYRTRSQLYNQTPITIAYTGQTTAPFDPVDDVDDVRNDVTVERRNGSSARAVQLTGPLAAVVPPDGVGIYTTSETLNLLDDSELADQAGWRLHLGTVDEPRYPAITVQLAAPDWVAAPSLRTQLLALDVGGVLEVTGPPAWVSGRVRTLVTGYSETIGEYTWSITFNGVPASPWDVAEVDGEQRPPADGSGLAIALSSSGTSLLLTSSIDNGPWTEDKGDLPLGVRVGGEEVTADGPLRAADPFTRTVANSWGVEPGTGQVWQHFGSAASFAVTGTAAQHIHTAVNSGRISVVDLGSTDALVRVTGSVPVVALGAGTALTIYPVARFTDDNNFYMARLGFIPDLNITCSIRKRVAGVDTTIASIVTGLTHVAGTRYTVELDVTGSTLYARVWREGDPVPAWQTSATDTALTTGTKVGVRTIIDAGSGNTMPLTYTIDDFSAVGPAIGPSVRDAFSVAASNGWGPAWTTTGGSASDYSVSGGSGRQAHTTVGALRHSFIAPGGGRNFTIVFDAQVPVMPTGGGISVWAAVRAAGTNDYYAAQLLIAVGGAATLGWFKRVGGSLAGLGSSVPVGTHTAGATWRIQVAVLGSSLHVKAWMPATQNEPGYQVIASDSSISSGTQVGVLSRLETGNTNALPVTVAVDNFTVINPQVVNLSARGVNGVQATWPAGTEVDVADPALVSL